MLPSCLPTDLPFLLLRLRLQHAAQTGCLCTELAFAIVASKAAHVEVVIIRGLVWGTILAGKSSSWLEIDMSPYPSPTPASLSLPAHGRLFTSFLARSVPPFRVSFSILFPTSPAVS